MYLEHRMRTFQGTFHASPDYAMWYGWSEMQRDLTEIKELATTCGVIARRQQRSLQKRRVYKSPSRGCNDSLGAGRAGEAEVLTVHRA